MRLIFKLAIFCAFPFLAAAQSNYRPGYVVTAHGDTIKGFIDYKAWDANPSSITFKAALADRNTKSYSLANASAFGIDNLTAYRKSVISISMDITNTLHLGEGRDTSFKIEPVFIKILQTGKNLALYSYTDSYKTRFYIGEAPGYNPVELVFRLYYDIDAKKGGRTVNENTYQKQLFALALKYKALDDNLTNLIEKADYERGDLLTIVSKINQISKAEFKQKYNQQPKVRLYASAGVNMVSTTSTSSSGYTEQGGGPESSVLPFFAVGADLFPDPNRRMEFKLDLSLNPAQFNSVYTLNASPYQPVRVTYDQLGLYLAPQGMFNIYNGENFKFYLGLGFMLAYNTYSNAYFGSKNGSNTNIIVAPYYFNRFGDGFLFKAGIRIDKKIEVFFNYYGSTDATRQGYFMLSSQPDELGLSYLFGK